MENSKKQFLHFLTVDDHVCSNILQNTSHNIYNVEWRMRINKCIDMQKSERVEQKENRAE